MYKINLSTFLPFLFFYTLSGHSVEKPLYVVVTSYNNAKWVKNNLDSILSQDYSNYHINYIDDASTDNTSSIVEDYIQQHQCKEKITLIKNKTRQWKLKNLYKIYHQAADWDIIVQIDGDDWLPHTKVFQKVNDAYRNNNIWITYGCFMYSSPNTSKKIDPENSCGLPGTPTDQEIIDRNQFRIDGWNYMPIRTFYAWLFKLVKLENLITNQSPGFEGNLYPLADDQAMMYPMLEMASKNHIHFFPNLMYCASYPEMRKGDQDLALAIINETCVNEIKYQTPYTPLEKPIIRNLKSCSKAKAALFILADDTTNLLDYLFSIEHYAKGYSAICILYEANTDLQKNIIDLLPFSKYISSFNLSIADERVAFEKYYNALKDNYILLSSSNYPFSRNINLGNCIYWLEKTYAYGFYFNINFSQNFEKTFHPNIQDDIYCWKFILAKNNTKPAPHSNMGILFRKHQLKDFITNVIKKGYSGVKQWHMKYVNTESIGLFYGDECSCI